MPKSQVSRCPRCIARTAPQVQVLTIQDVERIFSLELLAWELHKTLDEWRAMLDPEQYNVCRLKGTERPFSGKYNATKTPGVHHCVCCQTPLFDSAAKFDSGCGWPSL